MGETCSSVIDLRQSSESRCAPSHAIPTRFVLGGRDASKRLPPCAMPVRPHAGKVGRHIEWYPTSYASETANSLGGSVLRDLEYRSNESSVARRRE